MQKSTILFLLTSLISTLFLVSCSSVNLVQEYKTVPIEKPFFQNTYFANPEILKKTYEDGHVIGNHSFSHSNFFDFYRKDRVVKELRATNKIIEKIIGKKVCFFRPPYGVTNPSIARALSVTKHKVIGWNIRSMDGIIKNEKIIYNRIAKRISPGAIVLLHDTSLTTVSVLEQLLLFLRANKYEIVGVEELLNLKAYEN